MPMVTYSPRSKVPWTSGPYLPKNTLTGHLVDVDFDAYRTELVLDQRHGLVAYLNGVL